MNLTHSHTGLSTYDNCPEQFRQLYIVKEFKKPPYDPGVDIHKLLEQRVRYRQPLPASLNHAEPFVQSLEQAGKPEVEVSLAAGRDGRSTGFWARETYLRGKFDVVTRWPENHRAFIGDWKSGKVRESSDQLEIGALLLMAADPNIDNVIGANIWLSANKLGTGFKFSRKDRDSLWLKWVRRMETIEREDPAKEWERRESGLCGWCPVKSCRHYRGG